MNIQESSLSRLSAIDVAVLAGLMVIFYMQVPVFNGDSLLAWPITDSLMHPDRYSPNDLIVAGGSAGGFLFYQMMAYLPFLQDNLPLRDFIIYIPVFALTLVAWRRVFVILGADRWIALGSIFICLFSDGKLGLNWSNSFFPWLVSYTSVYFIQVYCLGLFLSRKHTLALALTASTGYFHPATALSFASVYAVLLIIDSIQTRRVKPLLPLIVFAVVYAPVVYMIVSRVQGITGITDLYYKIYRIFQNHAFLEYHFREGYAYTIALTIFLYRYFSFHHIELRHRREVFLIIGAGLLGSVLWLINLYIIMNVQINLLYFITRIFYFIKPILIFLTVTAAYTLYSASDKWTDHFAALLLMLTPLGFFSPTFALIVVVSCATIATNKSWWIGSLLSLSLVFFVFIMVFNHESFIYTISYFIMDRGGNEVIPFQIVVLLLFCSFALKASWWETSPVTNFVKGRSELAFFAVPIIAVLIVFTVPARIVVPVCENLHIPAKMVAAIDRICLSHYPNKDFNKDEYWGLRKSDPDYAALIDWSRSSAGHLFVVPPYDDRFTSFRYLTGKGVYALFHDINQLAYSPYYYYMGYNRLIQLGLRTDNLPKYRWRWDYEVQWARLISSTSADFIIFEKQNFEKQNLGQSWCDEVHPVFENSTFLVFRGAQAEPTLQNLLPR